MCSASLRVDVTREFVLAVTSEEQHIQHIEVTLTEQGSGTSGDYPKGRDSTIKSIGPVQILQAHNAHMWLEEGTTTSTVSGETFSKHVVSRLVTGFGDSV